MPPILTLLSGVDFKKVAAIGLGSAVVILLLMVRLQTIELKKTEAVYAHPQTVVRVVTRIVEGPVRIRTRIVEVPGGAKETTIEEERGTVTTDSGSEASSSVVPLSVAMAPARTDRYLLRFGAKLDAPQHLSDNLKVGAGYSIRNRLDLVAECHRRRDSAGTSYELWADATLRL
jgi:hypothetical protein